MASFSPANPQKSCQWPNVISCTDMTIDPDGAEGNRAATHKPTPWHEDALIDRLTEALTRAWCQLVLRLGGQPIHWRVSITQGALLISAERSGR